MATRHPAAATDPIHGTRRRDRAVNLVQATLGQALLLLVGLAVVLLAVILLLLEAKLILHLGGQLNRHLRLGATPPAGRSAHRPNHEPGSDEERRDDATG
jgi:hypothetical protein